MAELTEEAEEQWRAMERCKAAAERQQNQQQAATEDIANALTYMQETEPLVEHMSDDDKSTEKNELIT
jgi:septal ring factor EnvC (AmiA/AmiB activator)